VSDSVSRRDQGDEPGPLRVIIGAGEQQWDGWIPTHREDLDLGDPQSFAAWFGGRRADAMLAEHVWEHLSVEDGIAAARLCYAYLIPGGLLRAAVPDANFRNDEYQRTVQVGGPGPADHPAADHKIVYSAEQFVDMFTRAGFEVSLIEWCDGDGDFHVVNWSVNDGPIYRSSKLDHRNDNYRRGTGPIGNVSLIVDALVPAAIASLSDSDQT
jgi:predicted SAM-dependent methyltransferase